jgi:hypothetical protein
MRHPSVAFALSSLAAALATVPCPPPASAGETVGDVDLEIRGTSQVRGTIRPAGEHERFVVSVPAGSRVDLDALAKSPRLGPHASLFLGAVPVAPGQVPLRSLTESGTAIRLRGLEVERTGTLDIELTADGVGEFSLSVRVQPQVRWRVLEDFTPAPLVAPTFSAPLGASAVLTARPAKGSSATPVIADVDALDTRGLGTRTAKKHSLRLSAEQMAPRLDHFVTLEDASGLGGAIQLDVVVQLGGVPRDRLDLRGSSFQLPRGGEAALGRIVAPEDVGELNATGLPGLAWESPRFGRPVRMSLQSARVHPHEIPGGWSAVADGWRFDTEGEESQRGIELRLPLPNGMASAPREASLDDLAVAFLPDDGEPEIQSIGDRNEFRVRVWTRRPGRYVVVAPGGPGRVHGSSYWNVAVLAGLVHSADDDSRGRRAEFAAGRMDYDADPDTHRLSFVQRLTTVEFDVTPRPNPAVERNDEVWSMPDAWWEYDSEEPGGIVAGNGWRYAVSRSGAYVVAVADSDAEFATAGIELQVRRDYDWRTFDQLAGTWDLFAYSLQAQPAGSRVEVGVGRAVGILTIDDTGEWRLVGKVADVFDDGSGVIPSKAQRIDVRGTARRIPDGNDLLGGFELPFETPGGGEGVLVGLPGAGGRVFLGRGPFGPSSEAVLVGVWRGPELARLGGDWILGSFELRIADVELDSVAVGDWEVGVEGGVCDLEGPPPAAFGLTVAHHPYLRRDPTVPGGVHRESDGPFTRDGTWRQNLRSGPIEIRDRGRSLAGAADETGEFLVFVDSPASRAESLVFGTLVLR